MSLLYCYYGDDFTGSTDVLEQLAVNGVSSVLFLATPTPAQLARFADCQAIGFAGDARSRTPSLGQTWLGAVEHRGARAPSEKNFHSARIIKVNSLVQRGALVASVALIDEFWSCTRHQGFKHPALLLINSDMQERLAFDGVCTFNARIVAREKFHERSVTATRHSGAQR